MPRQKISEFRAKTILCSALDLPYQGWSIDTQADLPAQLAAISGHESYVVKVDEGVKGRYKKGLIVFDVKPDELEQAVGILSAKGYRWLIVEPTLAHAESDERYLSFTLDRSGLLMRYHAQGGVNIEERATEVSSLYLGNDSDWAGLAAATALSEQQLKVLAGVFNDNYFAFMEINPYLASSDGPKLLDAAIEVDDTGAFFVNSWQASDLRRHTSRVVTPQEKTVIELDDKSPASFKLEVLEPNGSIFLLLSGGGASVLIADEINNQGHGQQLANYGEYSGNPNTEETYIYTKAVLELLLASSAPNKILFIGGAVANFTDIAKTFAGVIQAIEEVADQLAGQGVKVFVRRGGPNQEVGLQKMKAALMKYNLLGAVHNPETSITSAVSEALREVSQ